MTRSIVAAIIALLITAAESGAQSIDRINLDQAVGRISGSAQPTVAVFYRTTCPISQAMFPSLVALAREHAGNTKFLVFSVDEPKDVSSLPAFLAAAKAPFSAVHIGKWPSGSFVKAMASFGVKVGDPWTTPLVMVRDGRGQTIVAGEGIPNVAMLARVLAPLK